MATANGLAPAWEESDEAAIRAVIEAQLDAFRRNDAVAAFSYAAPAIQELFGTAELFLDMVRTHYEAVYRPQEPQFRELQTRHGGARQVVALVGPDGRRVLAVYHLQRQPSGAWCVNGCVLVNA